ncbi:MAG: glycoside hydrolase family 20 zincin-like fold domain-containing protein [bacterium]
MDDQKIIIQATQSVGFFWASQTLFQLMKKSSLDDLATVQTLTIKDYPKFQWRGLLLGFSKN